LSRESYFKYKNQPFGADLSKLVQQKSTFLGILNRERSISSQTIFSPDFT
jgi:hypothetical protein